MQIELNIPMAGRLLSADITAAARHRGIKTETARIFRSKIDNTTWLAISAIYDGQDGVCGVVRQLVEDLGVESISMARVSVEPARMYFNDCGHDLDGEFPPMFERVAIPA